MDFSMGTSKEHLNNNREEKCIRGRRLRKCFIRCPLLLVCTPIIKQIRMVISIQKIATSLEVNIFTIFPNVCSFTRPSLKSSTIAYIHQYNKTMPSMSAQK